MCDLHSTSPADGCLGRRAKLWEIDKQWHCTIVGTCLSLAEIRGVANKFDVRFPSDRPTDYQIHTTIVQLASQNRRVGKVLTKLLDRKHATTIAKFGKAANELDLTTLWDDALARGDVAAACWAAMSHRTASDSLRAQVFSEVHMLSHQVGATARADLRQLHVLSAEKDALEAKVARQQERLREEIGRRDTEIRDLRQLLDCQIAEMQRLAHAAQAASDLDRLRAVNADLERQWQQEESRCKAAEADARDAKMERCEALDRLALLTATNEDLREENRLLEARMLATDRVGECGTECRNLDLCGRCILFVGGRNQHLPHFRRFVENSGGVFAHHDGGIEENIGRLHGLCGRADAVLFPVDCISHRAHDEVKQLCRRWDKPLVLLRRTGLGAFIRALETVATAM